MSDPVQNPEWEYYVENLSPQEDRAALQDRFNGLGRAGWELVQQHGPRAFFKRRRVYVVPQPARTKPAEGSLIDDDFDEPWRG